MASDRPTPYEAILDALRPGLAGGILENRVQRVVQRLADAGYVFDDAEAVVRNKEIIDELKSTLTVLVMMIEQVVDETNLDEGGTNLTIIADGQAIATLSLAESLRQASAAIAKAEERG